MVTRRELLRRGAAVCVSVPFASVLGTARAAAAAGSERSDLTFAQTGDVTSLNPARITLGGDRALAQNLYNGLVRFRRGHAPQVDPDVAESFLHSADAKTWTFRLRKGVTWQEDFGELSADDVKFTVAYHQDPANHSIAGSTYSVVESVETPDPYTVIFHLKEPVPAFSEMLAWQDGFILSRKAVTQYGTGYEVHPIGTGPYYFAQWVKGDHSLLTAHPKYFGAKPTITSVTVKVVPEEAVAVLALTQGQLDAMGILSLAGYKAVQAQPKLKLWTAPAGWNYFAWFLTTQKPFDDVRVRQALLYGANLQGMVENLGGFVEFNPSFLSPVVFGWTQNVPTYGYDLAKAKQLLAQAGYGDQNKLKIAIGYGQSYLYENYAVMLKQNWSAIADTSLVELPRALQYPDFTSGQGGWNVAVGAATRLVTDQYCTPFLTSTGATNFSHWESPEADRLIEGAKVEVDPKKRAAEYAVIQRLIATEVPEVCLGTMRSVMVTDPRLSGVYPNAYNGLIEFAPMRWSA